MEWLHERAVEAATRYRCAEADLVEILQLAEAERMFARRGHASLYAYVTTELRLSENVACTLITIARKARDVPALHAKLREGAMTLSNARRVAAVLTVENQDEWLALACELSCRDLEREIVRVKPEAAVRDRFTPVAEGRVKLEVGLSDVVAAKLQRVQDLLCQSQGDVVGIEGAIEAMADEYLRRHDPVEKARRNSKPSEPVKTSVTRKVPGAREPWTAAVLHAVNLRDEGRCTRVLSNGRRCDRSRWVEIHHVLPVSRGGSNELENLVTLCSIHHRGVHS